MLGKIIKRLITSSRFVGNKHSITGLNDKDVVKGFASSQPYKTKHMVSSSVQKQ